MSRTGPDERLTRRRRWIAAALAGVTIAAGLAVHRLLPDTAASDIAGDALYAALIHLLVVAAAPRLRIAGVLLIALVWCTGVELLQLTGVPERAGAAFPPAMLVLGTAFDPRDLVVYAVTLVVVAGADAATTRMRSRSSARGRTR